MDFHFFKKEKNFLFVANRFCWENVFPKSMEKTFKRVLCGVNIQNVISVKHKNLLFKNDNQTALFYNLLTVEYYGEKNEIALVFSQNAILKLKVRLQMKLKKFMKITKINYKGINYPIFIGSGSINLLRKEIKSNWIFFLKIYKNPIQPKKYQIILSKLKIQLDYFMSDNDE